MGKGNLLRNRLPGKCRVRLDGEMKFKIYGDEKEAWKMETRIEVRIH
jgi:hypothetical protein